ncbi:hypothetical protein DFR50_106169 [Roseiarcus fermentans]|uniref:Uncharacterized protein n=1 Tax=Roseiarcus fermentans TaxID=1473586 RepID=A0A366FNR5_9HYPH|nr:hypothetical protein [Roseiarcus fermentans]RBP16207.1 hypothetical protein DFR50_106169 [Roseiarcus fermentans]
MAIEKRTYADAGRAKAAIDELSSSGFGEVQASFDPGRVTVSVDPPFGQGAKAARILDSHGPSKDLGAQEDSGPLGARPRSQDPATPLSNWLGLPVLLHGLSPLAPKALIADPAPLSTWLGWPTLGVGPARPVEPAAARPPGDEKAPASTPEAAAAPPTVAETPAAPVVEKERPSREKRQPDSP